MHCDFFQCPLLQAYSTLQRLAEKETKYVDKKKVCKKRIKDEYTVD